MSIATVIYSDYGAMEQCSIDVDKRVQMELFKTSYKTIYETVLSYKRETSSEEPSKSFKSTDSVHDQQISVFHPNIIQDLDESQKHIGSELTVKEIKEVDTLKQITCHLEEKGLSTTIELDCIHEKVHKQETHKSHMTLSQSLGMKCVLCHQKDYFANETLGIFDGLKRPSAWQKCYTQF